MNPPEHAKAEDPSRPTEADAAARPGRGARGAITFDELERILRHPKPSVELYRMQRSGELERLLPELAALVGIEQPRKSHGCNAFDHTLRVVDAARADNALEQPGDLEIMLAALLHDIGKAPTMEKDEATGEITFHGHQFVSERGTRKLLRRVAADRRGIDPHRVATLVRHHMFDLDVKLSDKAIRRFSRRLGGPEMTYKLLDLRIADKRGGARPDRIGAILAFRKRVRAELEREAPFGLKDLAVNGHDLMELGVPAGPELGRILNLLFEHVLDDPDRNERATLLTAAGALVRGEALENDALSDADEAAATGEAG